MKDAKTIDYNVKYFWKTIDYYDTLFHYQQFAFDVYSLGFSISFKEISAIVETQLDVVPGDLFLRLFGTNGPREWISQFEFRGKMSEIEKNNPALLKLI